MVLALSAAAFIASLSLVGRFFFGTTLNTERLHRFILPSAVGIFLGIVFFELIPETLEVSELWGAISILAGFLGFYLLSHILDTYHHHHGDEHDECAHHGARKLLIGDAIHNFADGVVIATSFMINPVVGALTTIGIAFHEVPQEIAEYAILRASGYTEKRALTLNLLSATTVILGVLITFLLGSFLLEYVFVLTGIAAGNLLYIATTDLIPELRHSHKEHFNKTFIATILGIALIGTIVTVSHGTLETHSETEESGTH